MKHRLVYLLLFSAPLLALSNDRLNVRGSLSEGEDLIRNGHYDLALESCRKGLKILGGAYSSPDTLDDTGLKLTLADIQEKDGKLESAASITCRMLRTRYELWTTKSGGGAKRPNHSFNTDALTRAG
jgi:hypothetical protein